MGNDLFLIFRVSVANVTCRPGSGRN